MQSPDDCSASAENEKDTFDFFFFCLSGMQITDEPL